MSRLLAVLLFAHLVLPTSADDKQLSFLYLGRVNDPAYDVRRAYTGLSLRDLKRPIEGARLAIRESRVLARAVGLGFALEERLLNPDDDLATVFTEEIEPQGRVVLVDLERSELERLMALTAGRDDVILFNIRHKDDVLRGAICDSRLFHTIPSWAMLMDALSQFLAAKHWRRVLVLKGERAEDDLVADAFQQSAQKFGLRIIDIKPFVLSNDPRQREKNNLLLMTSEGRYDVVFVADTLGELGRYATFGIALPRPVVGTEGLIPVAWHWTFERYGAPQLNQRFMKSGKRRMTSGDWATWVAVRSVVEAARTSNSVTPNDLRGALLDDTFTLDLYKGFPGSYRNWSRQLRQPILLASHNAVITLAPVEGFEHQHNALDTLGSDESEVRCVH